MSAEYRPRFVCCRADREKGGRECTWSPPYDSHAMRCRFPPTAGGPAKTTPPFFRRTTRPSRWRRRSPKISAVEVYCTYKNSVDLSASSMTNSSRNFPGLFLVCVSHPQIYLQDCSWPRTSFGSKEKKKKVK